MSENENLPPTTSKQTSSVPLTKQTSSVPLKKETVRVTLKAADAPPAAPSATVPLAPAVRPPTPSVGLGGGTRPTTPAPTVPLRAAPAPTIPLRTAGTPTAAPAPTIRLATSAAPLGASGGITKPGPTPSVPGGVPTLPKATVQLQAPTQPLGTSMASPSQAATLLADDEEEEPNQGVVKILSGVGFAAALALLVFQLLIANTWISVEDNPKVGDWAQLLE